ncbi:hypothetical protein F0231_07140 [Vibrio sp. RE86]|uniref:hypothetical protein n=1 Tax=Vibrio sp. RE86 TaxID=2607605 RepID=UPI0014933CE6|nr:hypothetical protein [Vibrio sp. RE86]NOH79515.1 hypothetical protein [Vibrio sp. RE86]
MEFKTVSNRYLTSPNGKVSHGDLELTFPVDIESTLDSFIKDTKKYMSIPIDPKQLSPELRKEVSDMSMQLTEVLEQTIAENNIVIDLNCAQETEDGSLLLIEHALYLLALERDCAQLYFASAIMTSLRDLCLIEQGVLPIASQSSVYLAYKEFCICFTIAIMEPKYKHGESSVNSTSTGGRASPYEPWYETYIRPLIKQHLTSSKKKSIFKLAEEIQITLREKTDCRPAQYENLSRKTVARWIKTENGS